MPDNADPTVVPVANVTPNSLRTSKPLVLDKKDATLADLIRKFCFDMFDRPIEVKGFEMSWDDNVVATRIIRDCAVASTAIRMYAADLKWLQTQWRKRAMAYLGIEAANIYDAIVQS